MHHRLNVFKGAKQTTHLQAEEPVSLAGCATGLTISILSDTSDFSLPQWGDLKCVFLSISPGSAVQNGWLKAEPAC